MQFPVGQLDEYLAKRQENSVTATLGEFSVNPDSTTLTVTSGVDTQHFVLDDTANAALAKYLNVPGRYLKMIDPDFRATLLGYEFERNKSAPTTIETLNGGIVAFHQPTEVMLPMNKVAGVINKVFSPDDTVRRLLASEERLHIDVTTKQAMINVGTPEVGDITEAGVRVLAHPFSSVAPSVNVYAERLVCSNGQTTDERLGRISLRGNTVDEVINEMETAAQTILGQLDSYLERLTATRSMNVPGSPQAFAAQLAKESNVSRRILDEVLLIINQLPGPVSVWDVNQAFTTVANQVEQYKTMTKLQTLGGDLAFDAERAVERCSTCEQRLH